MSDAGYVECYDEAGITIWHGDCRDVLPNLPRPDAIITDPPYGWSHYPTDVAPPTGFLASLRDSTDTLAVFGYPEVLVRWCVDAELVPDDWITWWPATHKARGVGSGLPRESECVAVWGNLRGDRIQRRRKQDTWTLRVTAARGLDPDWCRDGDVWRDAAEGIANNGGKDHPNAKPVPLMRKLVLLCSDPGDLIVDPFMGSGSTLRAAKDLGRRAIGVEVVEAYCDAAIERLAQGSLFAHRSET